MFPVFINGEVIGVVSLVFNIDNVNSYLNQLESNEGSLATVCFTQGYSWSGEHKGYYGQTVGVFGEKVLEQAAVDTTERLQKFWDFNTYTQEYSLFFMKRLFRGNENRNWSYNFV